MRQEHRFCAEVYHRLYGLIDHDKRVLFCLDGAAARQAAINHEVECSTMPDLCFRFVGAANEIRIEAKIMDRRRVKLGAGQREAWGLGGNGQAVPNLWIGIDEKFANCWMWEQEGQERFNARIAGHAGANDHILVFEYQEAPQPCTLDELVKRIIAWAVEHGFKPKE